MRLGILRAQSFVLFLLSTVLPAFHRIPKAFFLIFFSLLRIFAPSGFAWRAPPPPRQWPGIVFFRRFFSSADELGQFLRPFTFLVDTPLFCFERCGSLYFQSPCDKRPVCPRLRCPGLFAFCSAGQGIFLIVPFFPGIKGSSPPFFSPAFFSSDFAPSLRSPSLFNSLKDFFRLSDFCSEPFVYEPL